MHRRWVFKLLAIIISCVFIQAAYSATITINTGSQRSAISPYIYGTDQQMQGDENLTCFRLGGNRMTGYNWENNASNAGSDWQQSSDDYMCYNIEYPLSATECANSAGGVIDHWVDYSIAHNYKAIITLPMAGYVAADKNGTVSVAETAPSARWKQVIDVKGSAFAYPPNTADNFVYNDEEVWHLVQKYGNAASAHGVFAFQLDNEADIWSGTHPRIHPTPVGAAELVTRSVSLAKAIKNVDQYAQVFGPVFAMIWSEDAVGSTIDWPGIKSAGGYSWYVDYYLDKLNQASTTAGKRLLDAIDIHYYSEAAEGAPFTYSTGCRITSDTCNSAAAQLTRLQAARTLWDPTYTENSSVGQWLQADLPLLPQLQASINTYYPGTKIAVTEHGFGGGTDYSGGICLADVLGVFGKYGVYVATMWKTGYGIYHSAAYKLYRNYNGANGVYGDTKVQCDSDSILTITAYASINGSDESKLHIIVLNKAATAQTANVNIAGGLSYNSGEAWAFDAASSTITLRAAPVIAGNAFSYSLPAHSAFHFILSSNATPTNTPYWTASPTFTRTGTRTNTPNWTATPSGTSTPNWTATVTPSRTVSPTVTQTQTQAPTAAASIVYDGDSAGARLIDGTVENNHVGTGGSMTEAAGGNPGNMMKLTFVNPNYWETHVWTPAAGKNTGANTFLVFNVRQDASSPNAVNNFYITINWYGDIRIDGSAYIVEGGAIDTTWKTVRIPLSVLIGAGTALNSIAFSDGGSGATGDYTVDIDNMRMDTGAVTPTNTPSAAFTSTRTGTPTFTGTAVYSATFTKTNTATMSSTPLPTSTNTPSKTYTRTFTPTATSTRTETPDYSSTATPTVTESMTGTPPTSTITDTITETQTDTVTETITETQTGTASETITETVTATGTDTFLPTLSMTPTVTFTPLPATATQTRTLTRTPTVTRTANPTATPSPTGTINAAAGFVINDVLVYPDPLLTKGADLSLRCNITGLPSLITVKIYTTSFRKIKEISLSSGLVSGDNLLLLGASDTDGLAKGVYYYVVFAENQAGKKARSKAGQFVILH